MTEKQFSSLVDDGVITQDQADALLDFMKEQTSQEKKASSEKHQEGFLSAAVDQGVITQDEADAIQEQWQKDRDAKQEEIIDNQLSQLVDDEIISQDESDAMKEFINEQREEQKAQMDQVKDMADEERKAFFEDNKDQRVNILDQMVDKGIITQDQADAMTKKIHIPALF